MTDFRKQLYSSYETKFNRLITNVTDEDLKSQADHYKVKLLPHISKFNSNAKVLELGCGPGYLLDFLSKNGFNNLTGIDISSEQIQIAKSKGFNAIEMDVVEYLGQNSNKCDIIFALDFIEHFNKDELFALFKLINLNLDVNGLLILRTPNGEGLFPNSIIYGDLTHQTILNKNSLSQLLSYSGFESFSYFENSPIMKNLQGIVRRSLWEIIKILLNFIRLIETGQVQKLWTRDFYCIAKK